MWLAGLLALLLGGGTLLILWLWAHWKQEPSTDLVRHWDRMLSKMMRIRKIQSAYHEHGEWLKQFDADFRENIQTQWRPALWKQKKSKYKYC